MGFNSGFKGLSSTWNALVTPWVENLRIVLTFQEWPRFCWRFWTCHLSLSTADKNVEKVREVIHKDRWPTTGNVFIIVDIPCGIRWRGLTEEFDVHIFLKYNQQDATFSRSTYFYKLLYMFQAVPPPTIRSTKLYIQRQVLSNQYCCLLLSWMRWN